MYENVSRARVLAFDSSSLYVQVGRELLVLDTEHESSTLRRIPLAYSHWLENTRVGTRLFRLGIHALCPLEDGSLVMIIRGHICRYDSTDGSWTKTFRIPRGSRPLFLCQKEHTLYFGEYFGNRDREAVRVYSSYDGGRRFNIAHTFPSGSVRHIHGIFADPYSDLLWLTTGDMDQESAIWTTGDEFGHLERVVGGTQWRRAVQLLFTRESVYFGSDAPGRQNFIYRLGRATRQVECLQAVDGPIFYGCKVGDTLFFSTVVEPASVRFSRDASLWGSGDGESWKCVAGFQKDTWQMKLFQYGQILFPSGENNTGRLWFTPVATEQDQTVQCLSIGRMFGDQTES